MNNQGNKVIQKENEKSPENKLKDMEYCDLNDREFNIHNLIVIKKLNEIQENSEWQFSKLKNKINKQKEYCTTEVESIKKTKQKFWSWITQ